MLYSLRSKLEEDDTPRKLKYDIAVWKVINDPEFGSEERKKIITRWKFSPHYGQELEKKCQQSTLQGEYRHPELSLVVPMM